MKKVKVVSLKEAIQILNDAYQNDPEKSGRNAIAMQTIYNALSNGRLTRHGSRHFRQVDVNELLNVFGPRKAS